MKNNTVTQIMTMLFGLSTLACTIVTTINTIKNADRRAAIAGKACGEAIKSKDPASNVVYL